MMRSRRSLFVVGAVLAVLTAGCAAPTVSTVTGGPLPFTTGYDYTQTFGCITPGGPLHGEVAFIDPGVYPITQVRLELYVGVTPFHSQIFTPPLTSPIQFTTVSLAPNSCWTLRIILDHATCPSGGPGCGYPGITGGYVDW